MGIELSKTFQKSFKALDKPTKQRVKMAIEKLPVGDVKRLQGFATLYRLRVETLRVIFRMENDIIFIEDIAPRGQVYKKL
jgi:mRNA-degrading endonuclease RelE of RelBE toxin-antitoxin system